MTRLARALSVLHAPVAAGAQRDDVIGNGAGREPFTEARDATQRIAMQDELAPLLVATSVATARSRAAGAIVNAPRILARMIRAYTPIARAAASVMAADSLRRFWHTLKIALVVFGFVERI